MDGISESAAGAKLDGRRLSKGRDVLGEGGFVGLEVGRRVRMEVGHWVRDFIDGFLVGLFVVFSVGTTNDGLDGLEVGRRVSLEVGGFVVPKDGRRVCGAIGGDVGAADFAIPLLTAAG